MQLLQMLRVCSDIPAPLLPMDASKLFIIGCGSTLGIAMLCGKGWIASQALAVILYMFNQEVPFPRSASSVCSFRCALVQAINDEHNDVRLFFPLLFTMCCLRSAMIWPCDCQKDACLTFIFCVSCKRGARKLNGSDLCASDVASRN